MPHFVVIYDKPDEPPDPEDEDFGPNYRGADFWDGDKVDTLLMTREIGVGENGADRYHVLGTGVLENITLDQAVAVFEQLMELPS